MIRPFASALFGLALCCSPAAFAEEEAKSPGMRLMEVLNFRADAVKTAQTALEPLRQQLRAQGFDEQVLAEVDAAADRFFTVTFEDPELELELAKVYEAHYTEQEIEELLVFYTTPLGRKTLLVTPQITEDSIKLSQRFAEKNTVAFQEELGEIFARHAAGAEDADEE